VDQVIQVVGALLILTAFAAVQFERKGVWAIVSAWGLATATRR
jgi:hypothetical protein